MYVGRRQEVTNRPRGSSGGPHVPPVRLMPVEAAVCQLEGGRDQGRLAGERRIQEKKRH